MVKLIDKIKKKSLKDKKYYSGSPYGDVERYTFINDVDRAVKSKITEYNIWYEGDADMLMNYYTKNMMIDYMGEPFFDRNKRNYFWSVSSTEEDIKRTHSGIARDIVDTLVAIIGTPDYKADESKLVNVNLQDMLRETDFTNRYREMQLPMTLVEGWGAWRIDWDKRYCKYPIPVYYRAENVDFIEKYGLIIGIIFKDYYRDFKRKRDYCIIETRKLDDTGLIVEQEAYLINDKDGDYVSQVKFEDIPGFGKVPEDGTVVEDENGTRTMKFEGLRWLLAEPCVFYKDTSGMCPGKSILAGRIDLMDDLDQCLSQASNTVRKSTPVEYFDTNYMERDKKGMPIEPKRFDRSFVKFKGGTDENGSNLNSLPITMTQPQLNFEGYNAEAQQIVLYIINGLISPATLGMEVAKKDNAEAQREKEKITIFTRNWLTDIETRIWTNLLNQMLMAFEFMQTGVITCQDYSISVKYPEFADESYENKLTVLGTAFDKGQISPEMYVSRLYGDAISEDDKNRELNFLRGTVEDKKNDKENIDEMFGGNPEGTDTEDQGEFEESDIQDSETERFGEE